jgi:hypothetical protein
MTVIIPPERRTPESAHDKDVGFFVEEGETDMLTQENYKWLWWAIGIAVVLFLLWMFTGTASAQGTVTVPETIVFPWGEWVVALVNSVLPAVQLALTSIAAWVVAIYVPSWLQNLAGASAQKRVTEVLFQALNSAAAQVKGAATGKTLSIPVANEVLRKAGQYAVDQAPDLVKHATGGNVDSLLKMLMARMEAMGMTPKEYGMEVAKKAIKPGEFSFDASTKKGMGG